MRTLVSEQLTFCEDKVVLLDELLECVGLQLCDIRRGRDDGGEEGSADGGALHCGGCEGAIGDMKVLEVWS